MSENCARPGCGHPATPPIGDYEAEFCHFGDGCAECTCPAYRTQAQQEAWEETATAFVIEFGIDLDEGTAYAFTPLGQAVASLLELYP
jgi:hypothetical protein